MDVSGFATHLIACIGLLNLDHCVSLLEIAGLFKPVFTLSQKALARDTYSLQRSNAFRYSDGDWGRVIEELSINLLSSAIWSVTLSSQKQVVPRNFRGIAKRAYVFNTQYKSDHHKIILSRCLLIYVYVKERILQWNFPSSLGVLKSSELEIRRNLSAQCNPPQ